MAVFDAEVNILIYTRIIPAAAIVAGLWYFRMYIHNQTYKRAFAWIMSGLAKRMDKGLKRKKTKIFEHMFTYKNRVNHDLLVLEIGAGSAPNLEYYPPNTNLVCLEPNTHFNKYTKANLEKCRNVVSAELLQGYAEDIGLEDGTVDVVVCTLVLCSVADPEKSIVEIKRVLKPGGLFLFLEHVAAADNTFLRRLQGWLNRVWMIVGDNCQVIRDTGSLIQQAKFTSVEMHSFSLNRWSAPVIVWPHIFGVAIK